jgi:hypothetical protein
VNNSIADNRLEDDAKNACECMFETQVYKDVSAELLPCTCACTGFDEGEDLQLYM